MRCPVCGSVVPDGLDVCPACHAELGTTRVLPKLKGTWCPSCGALVPEGATACPKCGMPVAAEPERPAPRMSDERLLEREQTTTLPRIESAIPSEPDPAVEGAYGREQLPHSKVFLVAALASVLVVGGTVLAITHPWDPSLSDTRATTPADTSQAGFPGTVSRLQEQDSSTEAATTVQSADEVTFQALQDSYAKLAELSARADQSEQLFDRVATSGSLDEREAGSSDAQQLAVEVSNLTATVQNIDTVTTGTYTDQKDHVATLASWLRNRMDALSKAWRLSAASEDPEADATEILKPMRGQRASESDQSYAALFQKNYEAWAPEQR